MLLARKGYRVLLVDRASFPSDTLSCHFLHQPGVASLQRWGLLPEVARSGCPPVRRPADHWHPRPCGRRCEGDREGAHGDRRRRQELARRTQRPGPDLWWTSATSASPGQLLPGCLQRRKRSEQALCPRRRPPWWASASWSPTMGDQGRPPEARDSPSCLASPADHNFNVREGLERNRRRAGRRRQSPPHSGRRDQGLRPAAEPPTPVPHLIWLLRPS